MTELENTEIKAIEADEVINTDDENENKKEKKNRISMKRFDNIIAKLKENYPEDIVLDMYKVTKEELDEFLVANIQNWKTFTDDRREKYYEAKYWNYLKALNVLLNNVEHGDTESAKFLVSQFNKLQQQKNWEQWDENPFEKNFLWVQFNFLRSKWKLKNTDEDDEIDENDE